MNTHTHGEGDNAAHCDILMDSFPFSQSAISATQLHLWCSFSDAMTIAFSFCAMVVCDSFVMVIMSADRVDQLRRMLLARLRESISAVDGVIINER